MRVALIHDYLNQYGGAERVLEALHALFPEAPIYTSIFDPQAMPAHYQRWDIRVSFMQHLPGWRTQFRRYFLLYPGAFESFDLRGYDLIISSSSAYAKGIIPPPTALHICYCHTPMRFAWRMHDYMGREGIRGIQGMVLPFLLTQLRLWDVVAAGRVDQFIANSHEVARRIRRYYGRDAIVIPPPVVLPAFAPRDPAPFYLAGGRLVPYQRLEIVVEAFNKLKLPLVVFGDGRGRHALEAMAGPHIRFAGHVDDATLQDLYARCQAYIFPGEEDFGIRPLEAMAAGRPVIAYRAGGALETVIDGETGRFFDEPTAAALAVAVARSRQDCYNPAVIRARAEEFGLDVFQARIRSVIAHTLEEVAGGGRALP